MFVAANAIFSDQVDGWFLILTSPFFISSPLNPKALEHTIHSTEQRRMSIFAGLHFQLSLIVLPHQLSNTSPSQLFILKPSSLPSESPSVSHQPSDVPSDSPSASAKPSEGPSESPSVSAKPSVSTQVSLLCSCGMRMEHLSFLMPFRVFLDVTYLLSKEQCTQSTFSFVLLSRHQ